MEEVRFKNFQKKYDEALVLMESLIERIEQPGFFNDDSVSEYHCFREPMEEILYRMVSGTEKDLRRSPIEYAEIYLLDGSLLVELKRPEDAEKALAKAIRWNPTYAKLAFEHAETFKIRGLIEDFGKLTRDVFKIAYRPDDLARCYRNMGYYFVEMKEYKAAVCCLLFSSQFEKNDMVQSELYYISQVSGETFNPTNDELHEIFEKHGIPYGPEIEILKAAYGYGRAFYEKGDMQTAGYFLNIFTSFIDDESANKMMEDIKSKGQ